MWAKSGYWNTGEKSGYVERCNEPATERCLGGQVPLCGEGYTGELCAVCQRHFYETSDGRCMPCGGETELLASSNTGFVWGSTVILVATPRPIVTAAFKIFVILGSLVQSEGCFGDSPSIGTTIRVLVNIFQLFNLDMAGLRKGCIETSANQFPSKFWLTLDMMLGYATPSLLILIVLNLALRPLDNRPEKIVLRAKAKRVKSKQEARLESIVQQTMASMGTSASKAMGFRKLELASETARTKVHATTKLVVAKLENAVLVEKVHRFRRWMFWRLQSAIAMWLDIFALMMVTISVKGIVCIESPSGSFLLGAQPSVYCWSRDHLPVFLCSLTIVGVMGFMYPLVWYLSSKMYKTKKQMMQPKHLERWGYIMIQFTPAGLSGALSLLALNKAVLATTDVLQSLGLQAAIRSAMGLLWIGHILRTRPYARKFMNYVHIGKNIVTIAIVCTKLLFEHMNSEAQSFVTIVYVTVLVLIILGICGGAGYTSIKQRRQEKKELEKAVVVLQRVWKQELMRRNLRDPNRKKKRYIPLTTLEKLRRHSTAVTEAAEEAQKKVTNAIDMSMAVALSVHAAAAEVQEEAQKKVTNAIDMSIAVASSVHAAATEVQKKVTGPEMSQSVPLTVVPPGNAQLHLVASCFEVNRHDVADTKDGLDEEPMRNPGETSGDCRQDMVETNGERSSMVPMLLPPGNCVDVLSDIDELGPISYHTTPVRGGIDVLDPVCHQSSHNSLVLISDDDSDHHSWCSYSDPGPYNRSPYNLSNVENHADRMHASQMKFLWM